MSVPGTTEQDMFANRGEEWSYPATLPLSQGDLTGVGTVLTMTVKREGDLDKPGDAHALAKIDTGARGGVQIIDGTHATFTIAEALMAKMPPGVHRYDVEAKLPSGQKLTPLKGKFTVEGDVTRD